MADMNGEFPTIIGVDAKFKGELTFEKGARIEGAFEGKVHSKGSFCIAEGARVEADIDAQNLKVEGECKGNVVISEKLQLLSTARMEGDLRTNRLEIADGAIFIGNVVVGQSGSDASRRPSMSASGSGVASPGMQSPSSASSPSSGMTPRDGQPAMQRPRTPELRIPATS